MACRRAVSIDLVISLPLIEEGVRFDQTSLAAASFRLNNLVGVMSLCRERLTRYHKISPLQCNTPSPMSPGGVPLTIREGNLLPHIAIPQQLLYPSHRAFPVPQGLPVRFEAGPGLGGSCSIEMRL